MRSSRWTTTSPDRQAGSRRGPGRGLLGGAGIESAGRRGPLWRSERAATVSGSPPRRTATVRRESDPARSPGGSVNLEEIQGLGALAIRPDAPCGDPVRDEPEFEQLQTEVRKLELPGRNPTGLGGGGRPVPRHPAGEVEGSSPGLLPLLRPVPAAGVRGAGRRAAAPAGHGRAALGGVVPRFEADPRPVLRHRVVRASYRAGGGGAEPRRGGAAGLGVEPGTGRAPGGDAGAEGGRRMGPPRRAAQRPRGGLEPDDGRRPHRQPVAGAGPRAGSSAAGAAPAAFGGRRRCSPERSPARAEAAQTLESIRSAAYRLADFLRTADPRNPLAYRLPRVAAWLPLREVPPATDGVTRIPGYQPPDLGQRLREAADRGQWMGVLEQTEGRIAGAVLWLDLHRYAWQALDALGPEFAAAAEAVAGEVAGLLRRLPGVETLKFANGVPLADEATRAWIRERVAPPSARRTASGTAPATAEASSPGESADTKDLDEARAEARALLRQKKLREALQVLQDGAARSRTMRGRIRWGLEIGRICQEARSPETAYLHLRGLYEEVEPGRPGGLGPGGRAGTDKNASTESR